MLDSKYYFLECASVFTQAKLLKAFCISTLHSCLSRSGATALIHHLAAKIHELTTSGAGFAGEELVRMTFCATVSQSSLTERWHPKQAIVETWLLLGIISRTDSFRKVEEIVRHKPSWTLRFQKLSVWAVLAYTGSLTQRLPATILTSSSVSAPQRCTFTRGDKQKRRGGTCARRAMFLSFPFIFCFPLTPTQKQEDRLPDTLPTSASICLSLHAVLSREHTMTAGQPKKTCDKCVCLHVSTEPLQLF